MGVLIIDQSIKIYVKTTFHLWEETSILGSDRFFLYFTENKGMAFGLEFGGRAGKLALTLFRIVAVSGIGFYLAYLLKRQAPRSLIISIALVFAGATGNIIDSVFYGALFSASGVHTVAEFLPPGGGYESLLFGHVVDMFYFPLWSGIYPDWLPFLGGKSFTFFKPVFNVADAAISTGVISVLFFQRAHLHQHSVELPEQEEEHESQAELPE